MKFYAILIGFILSLTLQSFAQSDTLVITLKNNQIEKIAITQIQKIQFENITGVDELIQPKNNLAIKGNYPNPFVEQTNIEFEISKAGNVEIVIFDNSGEQIQTLKCENCQVGKNSLQWNCLDKGKNRVQSGVYYYEVRFGNDVLSKKMIMVK
jgi:flagellar hook assembly protein FlgD